MTNQDTTSKVAVAGAVSAVGVGIWANRRSQEEGGGAISGLLFIYLIIGFFVAIHHYLVHLSDWSNNAIDSKDRNKQIWIPVVSVFMPLVSFLICGVLGSLLSWMGSSGGWWVVLVFLTIVWYFGICVPLGMRDELEEMRERCGVPYRWSKIAIGWIWSGTALVVCIVALYSYAAMGFLNK